MYVDGIDNHDTDENKAERAELLKQATAESAKFTKEETFRENPVVAQWREAMPSSLSVRCPSIN